MCTKTGVFGKLVEMGNVLFEQYTISPTKFPIKIKHEKIKSSSNTLA